MSTIPQPFIDELLSRTDIVELIDSYLPLQRRGSAILASCPFHNEKTPSFNVIAKKQFYHCFGCGASGNAISFIMNYLHQGFIDALETLASRVGLTLPKREKTDESIQSSKLLYQVLAQVSRFYQHSLKHLGAKAIAYLKERGLDGETAKKYQLGYAPEGWNALEKHFPDYKNQLIELGLLIQREDGRCYDRYRDRVIFPIHDRQGKIIGFGGRSLDAAQKPKYLNSPESIIFQKNRELYGLYQALNQGKSLDSLIIVEGYLDVLALSQYGFPHTVAAMGTALNNYHIKRLSTYTKTLIFCFDGDNAGRQAAWKALEHGLPELSQGLDLRFIFLPGEEDPDSFVRNQGVSAFQELIQTSIPLSQYFIETLTVNVDRDSLAGKSQLMDKAAPLLQKIPEGTYKQLLIDELARITRLESHRLAAVIGEATPVIDKPKTSPRASPLRLTIALLLQNPQLYLQHQEALDEFRQGHTLGEKGESVLKQLLAQLAERPETQTAALIEAWRATKFFSAMEQLAIWEHHVPDEAIKTEFIDLISFLKRRQLDEEIRIYLDKSRKQGLNGTDCMYLQALLKKRHEIDS